MSDFKKFWYYKIWLFKTPYIVSLKDSNFLEKSGTWVEAYGVNTFLTFSLMMKVKWQE